MTLVQHPRRREATLTGITTQVRNPSQRSPREQAARPREPAAQLLVDVRRQWREQPHAASVELMDSLDRWLGEGRDVWVAYVCESISDADPIEMAMVVLTVTRAAKGRLWQRKPLWSRTWNRIVSLSDAGRAARVLDRLS